MSILVTILGLGALIAIHEAGHLVLARLMGMRVETFSIGFGPKLLGFSRGGTDYRLSAIPLGGYCRIAGFSPDDEAAKDPADAGSYLNKPAWRRFLVISAGPGVNYFAAFAILAALYASVGGRDLSVLKVEVMPGGAAEAAGMLSGDLIRKVDGVAVAKLGEVSAELRKPGPEVRRIEVDRAGKPVVLEVKPRNGLISVVQAGEIIQLPVGAAVVRAVEDVWALNKATFAALAALFTGKGGASLAGPIGIVQQASATVKKGIADFAFVLANISVGLAIFNFLPVPALDGGRLVFLGWEIVTGRRANQKLETALHLVGFLLLLALLLGVTIFGDLQLGKKLFGR